jgi:hypothetical protein
MSVKSKTASRDFVAFVGEDMQPAAHYSACRAARQIPETAKAAAVTRCPLQVGG